MAVLYFGASHVIGGIYLLPEVDLYCSANGTLIGQDCIDEYHGIWSCWRCGGVGLLKVYLHHGYALARCDVCQGACTSGEMPELRPRHVHDWQPSEDKVPPHFEPQRCGCGALWLKRRPRELAAARVAGLLPIAELVHARIAALHERFGVGHDAEEDAV